MQKNFAQKVIWQEWSVSLIISLLAHLLFFWCLWQATQAKPMVAVKALPALHLQIRAAPDLPPAENKTNIKTAESNSPISEAPKELDQNDIKKNESESAQLAFTGHVEQSKTSSIPAPRKRPKVKRALPSPSFGADAAPLTLGHEQNMQNAPLRYELVFSTWLRRFQFYPEEASGAVGSVQCAIRLTRQGKVKAVMVLESSGNEILDKAMQQAVMLAEPFPQVPESFRPSESEIQLVTELFYAPSESTAY